VYRAGVNPAIRYANPYVDVGTPSIAHRTHMQLSVGGSMCSSGLLAKGKKRKMRIRYLIDTDKHASYKYVVQNRNLMKIVLQI
jgi:hypothetical protein